MNYFTNVENFYKEFYKYVQDYLPRQNLAKYLELNKNKIILEKKLYPVHTFKDIEFRWIRTHYLKPNQFKDIMIKMFDFYKFQYKNELKKLFFKKQDLLDLHNNSHFIGLHSHSHPTKIENLPIEKQLQEYKKNKKSLSDILGVSNITSVSHPHGSYNSKILEILKKLNVEIGFDNGMRNKYKDRKVNNSNLEVSREDHSIIMKRIRN